MPPDAAQRRGLRRGAGAPDRARLLQPELNVFEHGWDVERTHGGASERFLHLGRRLGGELLGATVFEVGPGWRGAYHLHRGNEELLLVLEGTPTLRTHEGERELRPGDAAIFRRGPEGAHGIENRSGGPARFVVFSSLVEPDVVEYPDTGTVGLFAGDAPTAGRDAELELFFHRADALGYGEARGAEPKR